MKRKRFSDEQIAYALRQAESGVAPAEICRKLGVREQAFYRWKKKYAGMGVAEPRKLRQLQEDFILEYQLNGESKRAIGPKGIAGQYVMPTTGRGEPGRDNTPVM